MTNWNGKYSLICTQRDMRTRNRLMDGQLENNKDFLVGS